MERLTAQHPRTDCEKMGSVVQWLWERTCEPGRPRVETGNGLEAFEGAVEQSTRDRRRRRTLLIAQQSNAMPIVGWKKEGVDGEAREA